MELNIQDGVLLSAELAENETELVIPESVTTLTPACFAMKRQLRKVALPSTMIKIAPAAFSGCTGLEELSLYEWTHVGTDGFFRCDALYRVEVFKRGRKPKAPRYDDYFQYALELRSLREVVLHQGITTVPKDAFLGFSLLESVTLPSTLKNIEESAFYACRALKQIDLPASVSKIGNEAFNGCTALEQIDLPESLDEIGYKAFSGCTALKSVTIPPKVKEFEASVFQGCTALESITLSPETRFNQFGNADIDFAAILKRVQKA